MKEIVCGGFNTGTRIRSLAIAARYEGTVLYYTGLRNSCRFYTESAEFKAFKAVNDSRLHSIWHGKYFVEPLGRTCSSSRHMDLAHRSCEEPEDRLLIIIDCDAWETIANKKKELQYLSRTEADIIINIAYPEDLFPGIFYTADPYTYTEGWILLMAGKDHSVSPCKWENLLNTPRLDDPIQPVPAVYTKKKGEEEMMKKQDGLAEMSVAARNMGLSYGQYMTYLATHSSEDVRKKASYSQSPWKQAPEGNSLVRIPKKHTS